MNNITVHSQTHDYEVIINESLENLIKIYLDFKTRYFVIIDKNVSTKLVPIVKEAAPNSIIYETVGGESAKTIDEYQRIIAFLLENKINKKDKLIAIGGGSIGDLTGYVASTYKRGLDFINIPTTTLAMVDSSICGKNALNVYEIKNAIGTIYPPEKVLIGLDVLSTLNERNINNGLCEALKTGIILDKELFNIFLLGKEKERLEEVIYRSLIAKSKVVCEDENENGLRKILNFGHTIGHAIELESGLMHGEAIANGMLIMSYEKPYYNDLKSIIWRYNFPIYKPTNVDTLIELIKNDKKSSSETIDVVVCDDIEKPVIKTVSFNLLKGVIKNYVL